MPAKSRLRLAGSCALLLAVGIVGGAGAYLSRSQADARHSALHAFDERAQLAAELSSDTLLGSDPKNRAYASSAFAGPVAGLDAALSKGVEPSVPWMVVLSKGGSPVAAAPSSAALDAPELRTDPGFVRARRTGMIAFGDIVTKNGVATVNAFQPYAAAGGTRILVLPTLVSDVGVLLHGALNVADSRSYLVDSSGHVIVSTVKARAGTLLPAQTRDDYAVSDPVSGTSWHTEIIGSRSALLSAVDAAARSAWLIFTAFAGAVAMILGIGVTTLIGAARLAHARLHDQLTGLPGRSLFLGRTQAAIERGLTATLFLDLDGFKPVNDTYGHTAGDELLKQVAKRLRETIRPDDYASRFGGDEFLVLCPGLHTELDAVAVADRIRQRLTEPYEVADRSIRIGVSIGIATAGPEAARAEVLIRNADAALYRAKDGGRGRIEKYTADVQVS